MNIMRVDDKIVSLENFFSAEMVHYDYRPNRYHIVIRYFNTTQTNIIDFDKDEDGCRECLATIFNAFEEEEED